MSEAKLSKTLLETIPFLICFVREEIKKAASDTMTFPQFRVLSNISRGLDTVGAIAEHQGVAQPAMTRAVNTLVEKNWVLRKKSKEDARKTILSLTKKGRNLLQEIRKEAQKGISCRLSEVPSKDKVTITKGLNLLRSSID